MLLIVAGTGQDCTDLPAPLLEDEFEEEMGSSEGSAPEQTGEDKATHDTPADPADPAPPVTRGTSDEPRPVQPAPTPPQDQPVENSPPASDPPPVNDPPPANEEPPPSQDPPTEPAEPATPPILPSEPVPQTQLKPIARWDVVPHQRINADGVLNVGVVAFSKYGISHVRFLINGQGYTGPSPVDVTEMTWNEKTDTYEYWTPIYGADFTSDGPITVEAEVYGHDGGLRDKHTDGGGVGLDPLPLVVNPKGALPQVQAWVSPAGNDATGAVEDPGRPFATIARAIDAIRQHRSQLGFGNNADGGVVRLTPGSHGCSSGGVAGPIQCDDEWLTITTAAGGTYENTVLLPGGIVPTRKIALRGIRLQGSGTIGMSYDHRQQTTVWADGCDIIGSGRGISTAHPLSCEYARLYYTGCSISQVHQATSGSNLCRNLSIYTISDDAFQNVPLVINCVVDDVDPLDTGAHADVWQHGGGNSSNKIDDNVIVYNLVARGLKYQSIFIRGDVYSPPSMAQGMAFVNVYMEMRPDSHGWAGWGRWVDHLLWWHCSFAFKGMGFMSDSYAGGPKVPCRVTNLSVKGCDFAFFGDGGAEVDWAGFDSNHFAGGDLAVGTNVTEGDRQVDADGVPLAGSPLVDRLDAIVPVDVNNNVRGARTDVGAFER